MMTATSSAMVTMRTNDAIEAIRAASNVYVQVMWMRGGQATTAKSYLKADRDEVVSQLGRSGLGMVDVMQYGDDVFLGW